MGHEKSSKDVRVQVASSTGPLWAIGWLFTLGFAGISGGKAVFALLVWPFYLGKAILRLIGG